MPPEKMPVRSLNAKGGGSGYATARGLRWDAQAAVKMVGMCGQHVGQLVTTKEVGTGEKESDECG